eukprot:1158495-Pelagomonas_calceolata.AAC.6
MGGARGSGMTPVLAGAMLGTRWVESGLLWMEERKRKKRMGRKESQSGLQEGWIEREEGGKVRLARRLKRKERQLCLWLT